MSKQDTLQNSSYPTAFICHASEDKNEAVNIAAELRNNGVEAWIDQWEIRPGDSLRQKIEQGIDGADFFIAIVSDSSKDKPWVNQELDAALIKKIEGQTKIIPVINNISHDQIPLLLRSMRYIRIDCNNHIRDLIDTCLGNSPRPPVIVPTSSVASTELGISPTAFQVAREINIRCKYGFIAETAIAVETLAEVVGISNEDAVLAITELEDEGYVKYGRVMGGYGTVLPTNQLFVSTDKLIHGFDASDDVTSLVSAMVNDGSRQFAGEDLCKLTGWEPRRLNPALSILMDGNHVNASRSMGSAPYIASSVLLTDRTRLFARRFS